MIFKVQKKIIRCIQYFVYNNTLNIYGDFSKGENSKISNSKINVSPNAKLIIADNVEIQNVDITILKGELKIGTNSILTNGYKKENSIIHISDGFFSVNKNCVIKADFYIKYGGKCSIGSYTGIMENTEIRCDDSIEIGDYNMISYECMIYDTNTHFIYPKDKRREMTIRDFPAIGLEHEKPTTQPVKIGNDCWLGKRAVILKGVTIGDESIIGALAVVTKKVDKNMICYGNPAVCKAR